MKNNSYRDLIFTNHALSRLHQRRIDFNDIYNCLHDPEIKTATDKPSAYKFIKTVGNRRIHVIANYLAQEKKWLVVSVWVRGEEDKAPLFWRILFFPYYLWKFSNQKKPKNR